MSRGNERDVVVVGAGIVGLACAYKLAGAGLDVEVLEARSVGSGASSGNTGWVVPTLSTPLAAPGMTRAGLRSAFDPGGALVFRPTLDLSWIR
jgi:D-amino-acid dehydrogenase